MRRIYVAVAIAFVVSVVHYADNVVNFADYPQPSAGPAPSASVIGVSWFVFTAFAGAAIVLLRRGQTMPAALCLSLYSISGLIGLGHYTVPGAFDMPLWRQAHVGIDVACGVVILGLAIGLLRERPRPA